MHSCRRLLLLLLLLVTYTTNTNVMLIRAAAKGRFMGLLFGVIDICASPLSSVSFSLQADFERIMGAVESGGFVHCDLSATGSRMAGCTAKGQLIDWVSAAAGVRCPVPVCTYWQISRAAHAQLCFRPMFALRTDGAVVWFHQTRRLGTLEEGRDSLQHVIWSEPLVLFSRHHYPKQALPLCTPILSPSL